MRLATVYPRWRGELNYGMASTRFAFGLSPLARGTRWGLMLELYRQRFIPAGAGNSATSERVDWSAPVYPRWRGELRHRPQTSLTAAGLSPLARGTRID